GALCPLQPGRLRRPDRSPAWRWCVRRPRLRGAGWRRRRTEAGQPAGKYLRPLGGSLGRSSLLLWIECIRTVLGPPGLTFKLDGLFGRGDLTLLGLALGPLGGLVFLLALGLGLGLFLGSLFLRTGLGAPAVLGGPFLGLPGGDLVLEPAALELGFSLLLAQLRLLLGSGRFDVVLARVDFGLGLGALQAALAGQAVVVGGLA